MQEKLKRGRFEEKGYSKCADAGTSAVTGVGYSVKDENLHLIKDKSFDIATGISRKLLINLANVAFRDAPFENIIKEIDFETIIEEKCEIKWLDIPPDLIKHFEKLLKKGDLSFVTTDLVKQLYSYDSTANRSVKQIKEEFITAFTSYFDSHGETARQIAENLYIIIDSGSTKVLQKENSNESKLNSREHKELIDKTNEMLDLISKNQQQSETKKEQLNPPANLESEIETYLKMILGNNIFDIADIYTEVSVRKREEFKTLNNLYNNCEEKEIDVSDFLKRENILIIQGPSGSGKTTTLRWLAAKYANEYLEGAEKLIPVYVDLNTCSSSENNDFKDYIRTKFGYFFPKINDNLVDQILKHKKPLFLIDGLDLLLVRKEYDPYIKISNFIISNKEYKFIISSRPGYYNKLEISPTIDRNLAEIRPLDDNKIRTFIKKASIDSSVASNIEEMVFDHLRRGADLRNPMMLKMFILAANSKKTSTKDILSTKAEIYTAFIENLYEHNEKRKTNFNAKVKQLNKALSGIFFAFQTENKVHGNEDFVIEVAYNSAKLKAYKEVSGDLILDDLYKLGMLRKENNIVTFGIHQSFQEYYAARKLKELFDAGEDVTPTFHHPKWEEVVIFVSEMFDTEAKTDEFVDKIISSEELSLAASCTFMASKQIQKNLLNKICDDSEIHFSQQKTIKDITKLMKFGRKCEDEIHIYLVNLLSSSINPDVKSAAAWALGEIKAKEAVRPLIEALEKGDPMVKLAAAWAFGEIKDVGAVEPLIQALKQENIRWDAVAFGEIKEKEEVKSLHKKLKQKSIMRAAMLSLEKISTENGVSLLIEALKAEDPEVSSIAAKVLGKIKATGAVPLLIKSLEKGDIKVRRAAAEALGNINAVEAVPLLIEALKDRDKNVRKSAALALGEVKAVEAIQLLIEALKDRDKNVRESAALALGEINAVEAIPLLIEALKDGDQNIRNTVALALGEIKAAEAIPLLIEALKDRDKNVRESAALALGEKKAVEAVPSLIEALKDGDYNVSESVAYALGEIKAIEAIPSLIEALKDENQNHREAVVWALGNIEAVEAASLLIEALEKGDVKVRRAAAVALGGIKVIEAIPPLIEALNDGDYNVSESAAYALGEIKAIGAIPSLIEALEKRAFMVRGAGAAYALGEIKSIEAVPSLIEALEKGDLMVRRAAAYALGEIRAIEAIPSLIEALKDEDMSIQQFATEALRNCISETKREKLKEFIDFEKESEVVNIVDGILIEFILKKAANEKIMTEFVLI